MLNRALYLITLPAAIAGSLVLIYAAAIVAESAALIEAPYTMFAPDGTKGR